jgi:prepilin-type processing-associated H-X9-DG protein
MSEYVKCPSYATNPNSSWFCPSDDYVRTPYRTEEGYRAYQDSQIYSSYSINTRLSIFGSSSMSSIFWMQPRYIEGKKNSGNMASWTIGRPRYSKILTSPNLVAVFQDDGWYWTSGVKRKTRAGEPELSFYWDLGVAYGPVRIRPFGSWHGRKIRGNIAFLDGHAATYDEITLRNEWWDKTGNLGPLAFNY